MKKLYIHIGLGKTGTTSIQSFLSSHSQKLKQEGVHYIMAGGGASGCGHQTLAKSCIDNVPYYMEIADSTLDVESILSEIKSTQCESILLSSENFQLANPGRVRSLFDRVEGGLDYRIILFVRSQDELLESEFNQMVKVKSLSRSLMEYADCSFDGNFDHLASQWASVFGEHAMICRVYNAAEKNAIEDFLNCLPVSLKLMGGTFRYQPIFMNQSLDSDELHKLYLENTKANSFRETMSEGKRNSAPAVLMDGQTAKEFRASYHESNLRFSSKFLPLPVKELGGVRFSDLDRDRYVVDWSYLYSD